MNFQPYPFEKLTALFADITPNGAYEPLTLTVGEPQFATPKFIQDALCESTHLLQKYPKTAGEESLKESMRAFMRRRFGVVLRNEELVPTFGTREVLFNFPQFLLFEKTDPVMAFTNPFYQIYEGAAIASRAKVRYIDLIASNGFQPVIDEERLAECDLVIINFPNNPTAATLTVEALGRWVELALRYDFVLINDECYSEVYVDTPPPSLLEASIAVGNDRFKNVLVVNSVSKRSNAPGLRSGFIAGDAAILSEYMRYRTYVGAASPLPLQAAATLAWSDDTHVADARAIYKENFAVAEEILGVAPSEATFYIWFHVNDAIDFTCKLYENYNLKVLPGEYLARRSGSVNPGEGYIRIALVESVERTREALMRVKEALDAYRHI